jgi:hypothetical protein
MPVVPLPGQNGAHQKLTCRSVQVFAPTRFAKSAVFCWILGCYPHQMMCLRAIRHSVVFQGAWLNTCYERQRIPHHPQLSPGRVEKRLLTLNLLATPLKNQLHCQLAINASQGEHDQALCSISPYWWT